MNQSVAEPEPVPQSKTTQQLRRELEEIQRQVDIDLRHLNTGRVSVWDAFLQVIGIRKAGR
jgi:hypothetical protein